MLGLDRLALQTGDDERSRIYGANFPADLRRCGDRFRPRRGCQARGELVAEYGPVEVEVAKDAVVGPRDVSVAGGCGRARS